MLTLVKVKLTGHPTQHLRNMSILGDKGADPVVSSRTLPPRVACTLLNTNLSHQEFLRIMPLKYGSTFLSYIVNVRSLVQQTS